VDSIDYNYNIKNNMGTSINSRTSWPYHWNGNKLLDTKFKEHINDFENILPELLSYPTPKSSIKYNNGFPIYEYKGDQYIYETQKMRLPKNRKYSSMSDFIDDMLNNIDRRIIENWKDGQYKEFYAGKFCHSSPHSIISNDGYSNDVDDDFDDIIEDILQKDECSDDLFDEDNWKQRGINDSIESQKEELDSIMPYNIDTQKETRRTCFVAFYSPFHFSGNQAGIYYSSYGIVKKAQFILDLSNKEGWNYSKEECYIIAKIMTFHHEFYHHKIETIATRIEINLRKRIYVDGFSRYYTNNTNSGNKCYEETLANLYSYIETLECLRPYFKKSKLHKIMFHWMKSQPKSYRNAIRFISKNKDSNARELNLLRNKFSELITNRFYKWENLTVMKKHPAIWDVFTYSHSPFSWKETNINYLF
jgi:hypothetical protein